MSSKVKSKAASASSPAPGSPDLLRAKGEAAGPREASSDSVTVYLASDRNRRLVWMLGGCVLGALLALKFGTVAAAMGGVLLAVGLYHGWFFVQTLLREPGQVVIDGKGVQLPKGLCAGAPEKVAASELGAAYFLRHAVPWNRSAPVLVIEAGSRAFLYPRDWFSSEADQRRIMHAVLPLISANDAGGGTASTSDGEAAK